MCVSARGLLCKQGKQVRRKTVFTGTYTLGYMQSSILVPRFSSCSPEFLKPVFWHASAVVILGHYYCKLVFEKLVPLKLGQLTHIIAFSRLQNIFCVENCVSTIWAGSLCSVHSVLVSTLRARVLSSIPGELFPNLTLSVYNIVKHCSHVCLLPK